MSKMDLLLRWLAVILFLLFIGECKSTKSIQRRFMWKEVDHTMDGLFDSMASSARAMKSMIGELIPAMTTPSTHSLMHSNILDYLPTETTKIKYIIRTETPKPMKILKMSTPKKVVKIMTIPKAIVEVKQHKPKYNFGSTAALRQLEKEQELIAEGNYPEKHNEERHKKPNEIISGHIQEFGTDWHPMPTGKSYPVSHLYTDTLTEKLPKPEKQIYDQTNEIADAYGEERKRKNSYEVTEHSSDETVAMPYASHHYQNSRGFIPIRSSHPSNVLNTARLGLPPKVKVISPTTLTTAPTTTTTTEAPNYPANFLKKVRDRPANLIKQSKTPPEINWVRSSNASVLNAKLIVKPTQNIQQPAKSQNWSFTGPTIFPSSFEFSTQGKLRRPEPLTQTTFDEHQRPKATKTPSTVKPRDIRQRGSIKFGDRLEEY